MENRHRPRQHDGGAGGGTTKPGNLVFSEEDCDEPYWLMLRADTLAPTWSTIGENRHQTPRLHDINTYEGWKNHGGMADKKKRERKWNRGERMKSMCGGLRAKLKANQEDKTPGWSRQVDNRVRRG